MKSLLFLPLVLMAGCACKPVTVQVKVAVPCIETVPVRPALVTDAELATMGEGQMVLALDAHRIIVMLYVAELETVVHGCAQLPRN
jgi:hypothetical protein